MNTESEATFKRAAEILRLRRDQRDSQGIAWRYRQSERFWVIVARWGLTSCANCDVLGPEDETFTVHNGDVICQSCRDCYTTCEDCSELWPDDDVSSVQGDYYVCDNCRGRNYTWCEHCDTYVHDSNMGEHDHDQDDDETDGDYDFCCTAEHQTFSFPFLGELLENDHVQDVTLPATGDITTEGLCAVRSAMYGMCPTHSWDSYALIAALDAIGPQWLNPKTGTFPKRVSRYFFKVYGAKLTPAELSEIGNIARAHVAEQENLRVSVTRDFNQPRSEFANDSSCWWSDYRYSMCSFKRNYGIGLRTFNDRSSVTGRAWVIPVRRENEQWTPCETTGAEAYLVFNGYGDLETLKAARLVAVLSGNTYIKKRWGADAMYINASSAYVVAPTAVVERMRDTEFISVSLNGHH